ncbi:MULTISPECIES: glycosyltransferase 87 family protein [Niastella]|uniref:Glycosyltransferase RgtA/B/C/D-like domain-containing protein n=1 Tax=Niastella soli TaxID=2821487 RepID=A0ABS3YWN8_9BACT|nr:glycosyltransferase 87 family protein [Niastella soli]MBO9202340.1 hypothetical protein [Niastella soli]
MTLQKPLLLAVCCFLFALGFQLKKSLLYENMGTSDLRNRIVGARMQKDGLSPYFFEWKKGDTTRYYDGANMAYTGVSNITASPFFHTLLYPIADLQQRTISYIWFVLEYISILLIGLLGYLLAKNNAQRIAVLLFFTLFLFTEAWKMHIAMGQLYVLIPLLATIIYYCFTRPDKLLAAGMAGLASVVLVLIRPNAVIFFVPLLFLAGSFSRKYLLTYIVPIILIPAIYFSFQSNRTYWQDYAKGIKASINVHQQDAAGLLQAQHHPENEIRAYEGWDLDKIEQENKINQLGWHTENGNVFVIYKLIFKRPLPLVYLNLLCLLSIAALLAVFFLARKKYNLLTLPNAALFGYCLYMVVDLFSPVHRHQHYTIQWLFPVLLAASVYKPVNKWFYAVLLAGLLLNMINSDIIKMEHTIGEYLILQALLWLCLTRKLFAE